MSTTLEREETTDQTIEHFDVVIVGAGISGIGTAYHLQIKIPAAASSCSKPRTVSVGPGTRTATPGSAPTATFTRSATASSPGPVPRSPPAAEIQKYLSDVIAENDLQRHIRLRTPHRLSLVEQRGQPLERERDTHGDRRDGHVSCQFSLDVSGLLPTRRGLHATVARDGKFHGTIVTPKPGPTTSTTATKR